MASAKIREKFLLFSPPFIETEEMREVMHSLKTGWLTTGPKVKRFEEDFRRAAQAKAALALSSCTAGMHLALKVLGIKEGDFVITTPMTFCSGVHVIEQVGAKPLLVDIESDTLNIDPEKIEKALRKGKGKIKAILPVHLGGHPCEMDAIQKIAHRYHLSVVEDAAHALAAKYKGHPIGSLGNLTAYSFYVTKNITTGEGGMLVGPKPLIDKARIYSLHGLDREAWNRYSDKGSWYYEVVASGYKYNMMDLQAAIGIHQLRRLPAFQKRRREIAQLYTKTFMEFEELQIPTERSEVEHAWHLYTLRLNLNKLKISRNRFIEELKHRNIGTSVHFIPIHLHPYFRKTYGFKPNDFPVAYREYQRIISLPIYPKMADQDIRNVISAVTDVIKKYQA